jgi:hypothetical protein
MSTKITDDLALPLGFVVAACTGEHFGTVIVETVVGHPHTLHPPNEAVRSLIQRLDDSRPDASQKPSE